MLSEDPRPCTHSPDPAAEALGSHSAHGALQAPANQSVLSTFRVPQGGKEHAYLLGFLQHWRAYLISPLAWLLALQEPKKGRKRRHWKPFEASNTQQRDKNRSQGSGGWDRPQAPPGEVWRETSILPLRPTAIHTLRHRDGGAQTMGEDLHHREDSRWMAGAGRPAETRLGSLRGASSQSKLYFLFRWIPQSQWKCAETEWSVEAPNGKTAQDSAARVPKETRGKPGQAACHWQTPESHGHLSKLSVSSAWFLAISEHPEARAERIWKYTQFTKPLRGMEQEVPRHLPSRAINAPSLTPRTQHSLA